MIRSWSVVAREETFLGSDISWPVRRQWGGTVRADVLSEARKLAKALVLDKIPGDMRICGIVSNDKAVTVTVRAALAGAAISNRGLVERRPPASRGRRA